MNEIVEIGSAHRHTPQRRGNLSNLTSPLPFAFQRSWTSPHVCSATLKAPSALRRRKSSATRASRMLAVVRTSICQNRQACGSVRHRPGISRYSERTRAFNASADAVRLTGSSVVRGASCRGERAPWRERSDEGRTRSATHGAFVSLSPASCTAKCAGPIGVFVFMREPSFCHACRSLRCGERSHVHPQNLLCVGAVIFGSGVRLAIDRGKERRAGHEAGCCTQSRSPASLEVMVIDDPDDVGGQRGVWQPMIIGRRSRRGAASV